MEVEGILGIPGRGLLDESKRAQEVARQSLGRPSGEEGEGIAVDDDNRFPRFGDADQISDHILLLLPVDMIEGVKADGAVEEILLQGKGQKAPMVEDAVVADLFLSLRQGFG